MGGRQTVWRRLGKDFRTHQRQNCVSQLKKKNDEALIHFFFHVIKHFRTQIHSSLKKKTFEAAGVPLPRPNVQTIAQPPAISSPSQPQQTVLVVQQPTLMNTKSTAEVTLNMLNASESEVDVEGLNFDASHEVVTS